jgi:hypothetical protein
MAPLGSVTTPVMDATACAVNLACVIRPSTNTKETFTNEFRIPKPLSQ